MEARAGKYKLGVRAEGQAKGRGMENTKTHFMTSSSFVAIKSIEYVLSVYSSTNCVDMNRRQISFDLGISEQSVFKVIRHDLCAHTQVIVTTYYIVKHFTGLVYNTYPYSKYTRLNYYKNCVFISPSGV